MKAPHWAIIGFTVIAAGAPVVAQFYPAMATVCHLVTTLAAAIGGALGLTTAKVGQ